jgi:hypothetical protein
VISASLWCSFYVSDDYGRDLTKLFEKRVRELGGDMLASMMHRNVLDSKGSRKNNFAFCCWPPGPPARQERRAIPGVVCEERATKHLPTRRSRQNVSLSLREPLAPNP